MLALDSPRVCTIGPVILNPEFSQVKDLVVMVVDARIKGFFSHFVPSGIVLDSRDEWPFRVYRPGGLEA